MIPAVALIMVFMKVVHRFIVSVGVVVELLFFRGVGKWIMMPDIMVLQDLSVCN